MNTLIGLLYLSAILLITTGLTIGLTFAPCYSSLCSEDFFPVATRLHIATFYALVASIGVVLLLRACSPTCRRISGHYLTRREVPILDKRISVGGLALSIWIVGITLATTGFWFTAEYDFWGLRTKPFDWADAQIRLTVTGLIGHHADILLGLVLIPVSRNSVLGRTFALHQSTLLYAHKLVAYLLFVAVLAHGTAAYTWVATYAAAKDDSPKKSAFNVDNPTLTAAQTEKRGAWHSATLGTGMMSFVFILLIVITALPSLRRRNYNVFYYVHVIFSSLVFIAASLHASTDFYFLLPGLLLWLTDWAWRIFRGDTGLRKSVNGTLEDAGNGWFRIVLPVSAKTLPTGEQVDEEAMGEKQLPSHPLQTYYLNIPSISKLQNHAFTAAKVGSQKSGPVFLFQRAQGSAKTKSTRLEKEWTWKVGGQASGTEEAQLEANKALEVRVEGPYIPDENGFRDADRVVCIVGGTGLTGAYSLAQWWLEARSRDPKARFTLIWTVRHRETAMLREWQELEERARQTANMRLEVHVSSEDGRLKAEDCLKQELAVHEGSSVGGKAWLYVSGPAGLLKQAEDACVDLERDLRKARTRTGESNLAVTEVEHYIAKWEV